MHTRCSIDSPWNRLPWTLPTALLMWAVALWALAYFMEKPARQPMPPPPIEAQFIEQTVPAAAREPGRPAARHQSKPVPPVKPQQALAAPPQNPHTELNPVAEKAEMTPNPIVSAPVAVVPRGGTSGEGQAAVVTNPSGSSGVQAGLPVGKGTSGGNMYATSGARAIIRPMPQIPDDLREGAFNSAALARFHVAADGSVKVELAKPTPNPRLNRILLDTLKKWRFMPAIKNGKPVASTEEIVIKVEVN